MIDILLPTFNGADYLPALVDSLFNQTYTDFRIIVRDDGSTDTTECIINEYANNYPNKFELIKDNLGNLGTSGCNNLLLQHVKSPYFMFCDQDDIWEANKIELSLNEMKRLERDYPQKPILVCSDALCFDENGKITALSFFESQKFVDTTDSYSKLLALNIVQGATALMNNSVLDFVKYIPKDLFHDWWVAVIVSYYGKISYIHKPLLKYRQHSSNVVGANDIGLKYMLKKIFNLKKQLKIYVCMYQQLPFKVSIIKWVVYKIIYNMKRL